MVTANRDGLPVKKGVTGQSVGWFFLAGGTKLDEQRAAQRQRVFKAGSIRFGGSTIDCTVRNLANTGAMLEVVSQAAIPHEFTLALSADRSHRRCHVVWRKDKRIGVTFY
jgi:hypothetical protein